MNLSVVIYSIILWSWTTDAHLLVKRAVDCPKITDFSGRVKYRRKGQRAVFRCPKSFTRYGQRAANCLPDGTWDAEIPLCVKDGCIPLDASKVYNLDMDVQKGVITFTCLENYVLVGDSLIYCDSKTWSAPLPRCAAPHELTECDFEVDVCGWTQDDADEVDWIRNSGITPTGDTGPKHDHTYMTERSGHYMYFETSTPTETGNTAALKSPSYPQHLTPICFDFWYHMEGPDVVGHVGDLDVYVIDESEFIDDDGVKPMFTQTGNQGSEWQRGEIKIEQQDESFQIVFVATKRHSYISDIAIDDVRLYNCTDNSTIGVTTTMQSSTPPTTTTSTAITTAVHTSPREDSSVPDKAVTSSGETTEQPTTVVPSHAPTKYVPQTSAPSSPVPTTSLPSTLAPTTEVQSASVKQTTNVPTTTSIKQTTNAPTTTTIKLTTTTQTPTTSSTARPTTEVPTTFKPPTTVVTTQPTRPTTVPPTTPVTIMSTLAPTTTTSLPTTGSPLPTTHVAKISTTAAPLTRQSTSRSTASYSTSSTTTLATSTTSTPSSTTTSRATSAGKTSAASSPRVLTSTSKPTQTSSKETATPKATKRSNSLTTKAPTVGNTTKDNTVSVVGQRSKHPEDDTLKPLMIGLGVGIVAGLIIIGVIAYVCVRRKKFYTSRYEDELKPITNAASVQSLNDDHFYKDEEYESES